MIICSCNVVSTEKIKEAIKDSDKCPSAKAVMEAIGCDFICSICAKNVKQEIRKLYGEENGKTSDI